MAEDNGAGDDTIYWMVEDERGFVALEDLPHDELLAAAYQMARAQEQERRQHAHELEMLSL